MKMFGELIVSSILDPVTGDLQARVDQADAMVLISAELVVEILTGSVVAGLVELQEGGLFTFGTEGKGEGRVTYKLGDRHDQHTYEAERIA